MSRPLSDFDEDDLTDDEGDVAIMPQSMAAETVAATVETEEVLLCSADGCEYPAIKGELCLLHAPEKLCVRCGAQANLLEPEPLCNRHYMDLFRTDPERALAGTGRVLLPLAGVDRSPPPPLVEGVLHPSRVTLLYGRGGTGKGVVAAWLAALRTKAGEKVAILDYEANPDEWARRIERFGGRLDLVSIALPVTEDGGRLDGPIWTQAETLREEVKAFGADWLVVDSVLAACMASGEGALSDPSMPRRFYAALRYIGPPALALGHVSSGADGADPWKPWGSVYWVNYARMTWSIADRGDSRELKNQKTNVYRDEGPFSIDWTWARELPSGETPDRLELGSWSSATNAELAAWIDDVPRDGEGLSSNELKAIWGVDPRSRIERLTGAGLLRRSDQKMKVEGKRSQGEWRYWRADIEVRHDK